MSRLNGKQIEKARRRVAKRDGLRCLTCKREPGDPYKDAHGIDRTTYLELDHIDNDSQNNPEDGSNHQLLCVPCNRKKSAKDKPRGPNFGSFKKFKISRTNGSGIDRYTGANTPTMLLQYLTMSRNHIAEPIVKKFILATVDQMGSVEKEVLANAAANEVSLKSKSSISQQAVKGYLNKMCNPINGILEYIQDETGGVWKVRRRSNGKDESIEASSG